MNKCLFCTAPCRPIFTIIEGQLKRLKTETEYGTPTTTPSFLEEEDTPLLSEQLKAVFILKNLLEIGDEKLSQFLTKLEGQLSPEFWVKLCGSCGEAVRSYYETFKEVSKLQKKLKAISAQLKDRILESGGADDEEDEININECSVWKEVREEVIRMSDNEVDYPFYSFEEENDDDDHNGLGDNSKEIFARRDHLDLEENDDDDDDVTDGASKLPFILEEVETAPQDQDQDLEVIDNQQLSSQFSIESCDMGEVKLYLLPDLPNPPPLKYLVFREGRITRFKCLECSFTTATMGRLKSHFEHHRPGSNAVACSFCGILVGSGPKKMELHKTTYHALPLLQLRPTKPSDLSTYFECSECGALFNSPSRVKNHKKQVHDVGEGGGSQGEVCGKCGWVVKNLRRHTGYWHPLVGSKAAEIRMKQQARGARIVTV